VASVSCGVTSALPVLDKSGFTPLYYQIEHILMEKIQSGALSEGDALESEGELARAYKVSRMTARQALHGLKVRGYAVSQKGRGTFVAKPKCEPDKVSLCGFTEDMRRRGITPSSRVLEQRMHAAGRELAESLKIQTGAPVMTLRRLRMADGAPMALERSCIPLELFPGIERVNFAEQSLYRTLSRSFNVRVSWADEVIEVVAATAEESKLLGVRRGASVLSVSRTIFSEELRAIEVACSRYRGDRYSAHIRIPATGMR
jgi:GntR family transcriptional regulator